MKISCMCTFQQSSMSHPGTMALSPPPAGDTTIELNGKVATCSCNTRAGGLSGGGGGTVATVNS
jgi:hypothetical protein